MSRKTKPKTKLDTSRKDVPDDPDIADVRRWRRKVWVKGGGTIAGVIELLQRKGVSAGSKPQTRSRPARKSKRRAA
jgi:hypothetical protein